MKNTKKLLALVLALMLSFSCMTMPAMAHGHDDEGVMPMYEVITCSRCGGAAEYQERTGPNGQPQVRKACLDWFSCGYTTLWTNV